MILCGALDFTDRCRPALMIELDMAISVRRTSRPARQSGDLFSTGVVMNRPISTGDYSPARKYLDERRILGVSPGPHIMKLYRPQLSGKVDATSKDLPSHLLQFSTDKKPVVVWNCTRRCNLKCVHCYSHSADKDYPGELTTEQGKALIEDLAQFGAPVILFSGGEPTIRHDLFELAEYAVSLGMRAVISTNGTKITSEVATRLKDIGLSYVGVSLDGMRETNDKFRGHKGAFDEALAGIRNCLETGIKVGLRFTINKRNAQDIPDIFTLLEE